MRLEEQLPVHLKDHKTAEASKVWVARLLYYEKRTDCFPLIEGVGVLEHQRHNIKNEVQHVMSLLIVPDTWSCDHHIDVTADAQ